MKHSIGIYSGSFDPVHSGHIAFAKEALRVCELDRVVFLPESSPRGKESVTDISHRLALLERATADNNDLAVVNLDSQQFTTSETLPELHQLFADAAFTLLVGSDVVKTFPYRWDGLKTLLSDVSLAIGIRDGDQPSDIRSIIHALEDEYGIPIHFCLINTDDSAAASSHIRKGIHAPSLNKSVDEYIKQHNLYS